MWFWGWAHEALVAVELGLILGGLGEGGVPLGLEDSGGLCWAAWCPAQLWWLMGGQQAEDTPTPPWTHTVLVIHIRGR